MKQFWLLSLALFFLGIRAASADPLMVSIPTSTGTDTESRLQRIEEKLDKTLAELKRLQRMVKPPPPTAEEILYGREVYNVIKQHWIPPKQRSGWSSGLAYTQEFHVHFKVDRAGNVSGIRLANVLPQGVTAYEQAALDAVKQTQHLPVPPIEPGEEYMELQFTSGDVRALPWGGRNGQ
jgi:TonB family protein